MFTYVCINKERTNLFWDQHEITKKMMSSYLKTKIIKNRKIEYLNNMTRLEIGQTFDGHKLIQISYQEHYQMYFIISPN